jgi:hypothetical protein
MVAVKTSRPGRNLPVAGHRMIQCIKKADVAKRPKALHHVGLLINKHTGMASVFFDMSSGHY